MFLCKIFYCPWRNCFTYSLLKDKIVLVDRSVTLTSDIFCCEPNVEWLFLFLSHACSSCWQRYGSRLELRPKPSDKKSCWACKLEESHQVQTVCNHNQSPLHCAYTTCTHTRTHAHAHTHTHTHTRAHMNSQYPLVLLKTRLKSELRQDPLEAILVIFGRRALIFFVWKLLEKNEKWHHFCAHAQWWSPWRRKNVENGHLAPWNLAFLIIAIDRNGFRRMKEEGLIYKTLPQIF